MKIALVTSADYPHLSDDDRPLIPAFAARGATAEPARWDDPAVRWAEYDLSILRSCWDYHLRAAEFRAWLQQLEDARVRVLNPPSLVRWNMDKRYLAGLREKGMAIPRTVWLDRGEDIRLAEVLAGAAITQAVVKPAISASATDTWRLHAADADEHEPAFRALLHRGDVMVQEFVNEVVSDGELSVVFIAGAFSHAVRKRPAAGDFRVQEHHGGTAKVVTPAPEILAQAGRIAALLPAPWLYARIDGVIVGETFTLMELECIEPTLYLGAGAYDRFVVAALALADARTDDVPWPSIALVDRE